ncbi:Alkaline phosphodiesterase I [Acidisarcina polymorpha]|uniref:Alkaline phosphodiesterase I n=1 Tax=Acidisarcina polymorpha TaxID=2211140 RepID=A0A2Z5FVI5_9BACT|nr:ectonucleotide pyrophosphatase/phosphodiesterase [Acidisarcina polymorpha]AXC10861.1 Alkaline phosphodiesterase I [Acidisarcina polymorpha]
MAVILRHLRLLLLVAFSACLVHAQQIGPVLTGNNPSNSLASQAKHYVVMVSLDGFRYDYAKKYGAKHLLALAAEGASAPEGMVPAYPSITFPNHYTLVTGLYPEHHGIVANSFYDPGRKQRYSYTDPAAVTDGSWYGGTPLWVLAEQQGMRSACFFWPGSEAAIQGVRPSYYLKYDDRFPDEKRIDQVLAWLRLPPEQRPHFITLYYANTDHAGHSFGPDSLETREAVHQMDDLMGRLKAALDALHLPIDLIVVADHGMEKVESGWIDLDKYTDLTHFQVDGSLLYPDSEAEAQKAYDQLKKADSRFMVYRLAKVPAGLHFNENPREGDPVIVPTGPYLIRAHAPDSSKGERPPPIGMHGYDPAQMKSMRAIFYATGPDIRAGSTVKPFENVNVYPFVAHILGLDPPKVDGSLNVLSGILAEGVDAAP